ncbi:hypothetical protein H0A36_08115 [Endozoicomonas sp. SM1973]|uniref:Uncharacterized protein n=1 Tax=Spartinivicinus marinus TaxID=2994442 RepID=A0A853IES2_9GAMM|nr:hypothetical protein [Spartinivicinus marinus]MCX4025255.1 hypothetical protein [Spartinivicinus marinus]NYZ65976.1 hypothetical protein [Spartinivicinus marinus]
MQNSIWLVALADFALLLMVLVIVLSWQLVKLKKIAKTRTRSSENSQLNFIDTCINDAQHSLDRVGEVSLSDILLQQITKRHILAFRKQVLLAEKKSFADTDGDQHNPSKTEDLVFQAYNQLLCQLQQSFKAIVDKQQYSFGDHLTKQVEITTQQERFYGQVNLDEVAIAHLSRQAVLALRKALFSLEAELLKEDFTTSQFYEALFNRYCELFQRVASPEKLLVVGESEYGNNYTKLVVEQCKKELQCCNQRLKQQEQLLALNKTEINNCLHNKDLSNDSAKRIERIAEYNELLEASRSQIVQLKKEIKEKDTTIVHLKMKSNRLQQNTEHILKDVLQDDVSMRKMRQDFCDEITKLKQEIGALKTEKQNIEVKLKDKKPLAARSAP